MLQEKLHGAPRVQWCLLSVKIPVLQPNRGAFLFRVSKFWPKWQQWCYYYHFKNYLKWYGIIFRGRFCRSFINAREAIILKPYYSKWVIRNQPHLFKWTIQPVMASWTSKYIFKISKEMGMRFYWVIDRVLKNTLTCFGNMEWEILGIILLNIACLHITK